MNNPSGFFYPMPQKITTLAVVVLLCGNLLTARAADGDAEGAENPAHTFDFSIGAELRDPFWPVGYLPEELAPAPAEVVATDEQMKRALAKLRYGGTIQSGGRFFATVNGAMVQEGDVVAVTVDGDLFKFRVHGISMKGVKFKHEK